MVILNFCQGQFSFVVEFNNVTISYFTNKLDAIEYSDFLRYKANYKLIEMSEFVTNAL